MQAIIERRQTFYGDPKTSIHVHHLHSFDGGSFADALGKLNTFATMQGSELYRHSFGDEKELIEHAMQHGMSSSGVDIVCGYKMMHEYNCGEYGCGSPLNYLLCRYRELVGYDKEAYYSKIHLSGKLHFTRNYVAQLCNKAISASQYGEGGQSSLEDITPLPLVPLIDLFDYFNKKYNKRRITSLLGLRGVESIQLGFAAAAGGGGGPARNKAYAEPVSYRNTSRLIQEMSNALVDERYENMLEYAHANPRYVQDVANLAAWVDASLRIPLDVLEEEQVLADTLAFADVSVVDTQACWSRGNSFGVQSRLLAECSRENERGQAQLYVFSETRDYADFVDKYNLRQFVYSGGLVMNLVRKIFSSDEWSFIVDAGSMYPSLYIALGMCHTNVVPITSGNAKRISHLCTEGKAHVVCIAEHL